MESTVNTLANVFERIDALPDNLCQIMEMEGVYAMGRLMAE